MAEVGWVVKKLGITNGAVATRAAELVRLATSKTFRGGLGQGECAKTAVCVELACMELGEEIVERSLVQVSATSAKVYKETKLRLQAMLGVQSSVGLRELVVQHGCVRLQLRMEEVLRNYKQRFVAQLSAHERMHANFSRPLYSGAAFYCVARKEKVKVDRGKLVNQLAVSPADFARAVASITEMCEGELGTAPKRKRPSSSSAKVAKKKAEQKAEGAEDAIDENANPDDVVSPSKRAKLEDKQRYEAWKAKVTQQDSAQSNTKTDDNITSKPQTKKLKQGRLKFGKLQRMAES